MNGWFLTILIIYVLSLGTILSQHGKRRDGKHNFWTSLIVTLLLIFVIYKAILTGF